MLFIFVFSVEECRPESFLSREHQSSPVQLPPCRYTVVNFNLILSTRVYVFFVFKILSPDTSLPPTLQPRAERCRAIDITFVVIMIDIYLLEIKITIIFSVIHKVT